MGLWSLVMEQVETICEEHRHKEDHAVTVFVNGHHVKFHRHEETGLEIKLAAIAQGVPIQQDFALFEKRVHHSLKPIGDHESVHLHEQAHFRAVAPDDNS
jgi:hypothetical protein